MNLLTRALIVALICTSLPAKAETLKFCYDPYPPYALGAEGPAEGGLKVQLLQAVLNRIEGLDATVTLMPWKRCQSETRVGNFDGILPLFQNPERATYMAFTEGTFDEQSVLWHRAGQFPSNFNWNGDFAELADLRLGMLTGSFVDADMEATFENGLGITRARDIQTLMQLLMKERVDLVATDAAVGRHILETNGWSGQAVRLTHPVSSRVSHFGLSKASGAARHLDAFNQAIAALAADGTFDRILKGEG